MNEQEPQGSAVGKQSGATETASTSAPGSQAGAGAASPAPGKRGSNKVITIVLACAVIAVGGIWAFNYAALQSPLKKVLAADSRNGVVHASAHFDHWFDTGTVVFDLTDVTGNSTQMDVFRVLLQFAREVKDHEYKQVALAAYGHKKFFVPSDYFQKLGQEYDTQNPMYTLRTFAHHVTDTDGNHPFPEYEGGILAVMGKEMDEFSDLNKQWYLNEYAEHSK